MKKIKWILSCLIVLTVLYWVVDYHRPQKIDLQYGGVIYTYDAMFEQKTMIKLKGNEYRKLIGNNEFIGTLTLDEFVEHDIKLHQDDEKYFGLITSVESEFRNVVTLGSVMFSLNFDRAWIQSDDLSTKHGLVEGYLSGPASTTDEANEIARSFLELYK